MTTPVYLDHNATTPLDPRVLEAMEPFLRGEFGNPSSATHSWGRRARAGVEAAREQVARLIGAHPREIVFTSCATEADNLAIKGAALAAREQGRGDHIIVTSIEHKAVLRSAERLESEGFRVTRVSPDTVGIVSADRIRSEFTRRTCLVSAMHVNSEIGTVLPVAEIGALCRSQGVLFHSDAVQGVGRLPVEVDAFQADLLALSGHKIYGPKGIGALYVRRGTPIVPLIDGGGQERDLRSGTLNVPGIVGLGTACQLRLEEMETDRNRIRRLRDRLWDGIEATIPAVLLNGPRGEQRQPGNLNVTFLGVEGEALILALEQFALSSGSACTSEQLEPSYVLQEIGRSEEEAMCSVRIGIGRSNTESEIDLLIERLQEEVARLREMSPLWRSGAETQEVS